MGVGGEWDPQVDNGMHGAFFNGTSKGGLKGRAKGGGEFNVTSKGC